MKHLSLFCEQQLSRVKYDHMNNQYPVPQTMAGVEIDVDSDEFQDWYLAFTRFLLEQLRWISQEEEQEGQSGSMFSCGSRGS
jgi:hypothetical protein